MITSIQGKVSKLEDSMAEAKVVLEQLESVDLEKLGSLDLEKLESMEGIQEEVQEAFNWLDVKMADRGDALKATVVAIKKEVEELKAKSSESKDVDLKKEVELLRTELLVLKAAFGSNVATTTSKDVENFLWGMDQYFKAMGIEEDTKKVILAGVYLNEIALMWWRRRCSDVNRGKATIETWKLRVPR
ncbi:hypothetical protein HRI_003837000 [Hibiscus trionum]|uniref:Uncharacterized protein n=1 Tax=Hibiscus trionum TaxID=183268 RepID=A0A9W7IVH2_HIBTR|nr:hypothetical protein HRI_003837000 [Hibiscus trionum]